MYTGPVLIYILDLVGVFAFAFLGARSALEHKMNLWGVIACAFLTALGGGTIRALILNKTPLYFSDPFYVAVVLTGVWLAVIWYWYFAAIKPFIMFLDAVGMVAFAYIGAQAAAQAHLGPIAMVFFAGLTAFGGGILCDLVSGQKPHALHGDPYYVMPPLIMGMLYWIAGSRVDQPLVIGALFAGILVIQLAVAYSAFEPSRRRHRDQLLLYKARRAAQRVLE